MKPRGAKKVSCGLQKKSRIDWRAATSLPGLPSYMPRPSHLSSDNILRFLKVRHDAASVDEIAAGLHTRRADRHALYKMLNTLKKRRAVEELPGRRYRLAGRKGEQSGDETGRS